MGTITSFFLYANRYDLKQRRNLVYIVAIVLSMSAAAFLLVLIGYMIMRFNKRKTLVIVTVVWFSLLLLVASVYNGGDNIINELIIGKFTRDSGALGGRIAEWTAQLWDKSVRHGEIIFGLGADALKQMTQSSGYKVYILQNGLVGVVLTVLAYWLIQRTCVSRLGKLMFLLYLLSFLQRTYCFWDAFLDPFILGIAYLKFTTPKGVVKKTTSMPSNSGNLNATRTET
ncbi:MAG: hypothetical protein K2M98_07800, partial [Muribaculum sp.]|nr:hypothetical protein [Muribaculum sp.]